jgi:hypothetical protein
MVESNWDPSFTNHWMISILQSIEWSRFYKALSDLDFTKYWKISTLQSIEWSRF